MKRFFRLYWKKLLLLLLLFAAVLRTGSLFAALDYDEIWTMSYFSTRDLSTIFRELSLPNNQPLNSLFVKFAIMGELPLWGVRLHSLAAGVLAVLLMVPIGIRLGRSAMAGFLSALFLMLSAPAVAYSQMARGYELQLFFLLLYAWGLLYSDVKKYAAAAPLAAAAGGVCSILTLPTSVIYLGVITAGYFILFPKRPGKFLLGVLAGGVLFSALWYGINFQQFRTGQQWGTPIDSHKAFFTFAFSTLDSLIPLLWCPFLVCGIALGRRKTAAVLAGGIIAVLLTALLIRGGPARVYIPLAAAAALLCGTGAAALTRRLKRFSFAVPAAALLCAAGGFYFNAAAWTPPDWYALFAKGKSQEKSTLVIYSGTAGFPVMWNNQPDSLEDNAERISQEKSTRLLSFTSNRLLNGVDAAKNEGQLPLKAEGIPHEGGFLYRLEDSGQLSQGDEIIIVTCGEERGADTAFFEEIAPCGRYLRLNIFFERMDDSGRVRIIRGGIVDNAERFNRVKRPENIKIYRIQSIKKDRT